MPLTQTQLAGAVAARADISRAEARRVLEAFKEVVLEELGNAQKGRWSRAVDGACRGRARCAPGQDRELPAAPPVSSPQSRNRNTRGRSNRGGRGTARRRPQLNRRHGDRGKRKHHPGRGRVGVCARGPAAQGDRYGVRYIITRRAHPPKRRGGRVRARDPRVSLTRSRVPPGLTRTLLVG